MVSIFSCASWPSVRQEGHIRDVTSDINVAKWSQLRLIEMSSHRIGKEEGQESLRNVNKAVVRRGRWGKFRSLPLNDTD